MFRRAPIGLLYWLSLTVAFTGFFAARAAATPEWMVPPVPEIPAEVSVKASESLNLLTKILGLQTTFSCSGLVANKALIEAEGKASGSLTFSGCKTTLVGETSSSCEPHTGENPAGVVTTNALKGQLALHEGATVLQLKPVSGETIATLVSTAACPIGKNVPLLGTFYAKDKNGNFEAEGTEHIFEAGPLTEMWAISKTTEHKATADGSATLRLAGAGGSWSGLGA